MWYYYIMRTRNKKKNWNQLLIKTGFKNIENKNKKNDAEKKTMQNEGRQKKKLLKWCHLENESSLFFASSWMKCYMENWWEEDA